MQLLKNEDYDVKIFWKGWIDCSKGSPGAGLFNIHTSGGWAEMAGNHPCTNIGGQTFNSNYAARFMQRWFVVPYEITKKSKGAANQHRLRFDEMYGMDSKARLSCHYYHCKYNNITFLLDAVWM